MGKIQEIIASTEDQAAIINKLKSRRITDIPDFETAKNQLDPLKHDINDKALRPDKTVIVPKVKEDGTESTETRKELVARVSVALQKLIVKRSVAFLFGNTVNMKAVPDGDKEKLVLEALERILKDNKSGSLNRRIARNVFSCTEAAELWFPVPVAKVSTGSKVKDLLNDVLGSGATHETYGFKSKFKLRCAVFSPLQGDALYPYFDETGDMIAFSREYQQKEDKNSRAFFETYTDTEHYLWEQSAGGWSMAEGYPKKIAIGKIPVIYAKQESFEWADVQGLIDRLEKLLSDFDDSNAYNAWPKIFTKGTITGFSKKGETGAIIEGEEGSDAKYLEYDQATESVKLEIDTLLRLIYTITQTPDISFDSVKDIGAVSGVALKLLFMDAHLKVKDKQEIFDEYLKRRCSVIKAFIAQMDKTLTKECESLEVEPEIVPFMIEDEKSMVEVLTMANGNKPLLSQKLSAKLSKLAQNADEDYKQMEAEAKASSFSDITEPTL